MSRPISRPHFAAIVDNLNRRLAPLRFADPVTHVYNPLDYAGEIFLEYLATHMGHRPPTLLLGMNPGPWGMAQTGVPFGEVAAVRDWLGIRAKIGKPPREHPKRPILGFDCPRSEVSGRRLWGWARDTFGAPRNFFAHFGVINYCPLAFLEESGRNRTPDKLPADERGALFEACDAALRALIELLRPTHVIGVGAFAARRAADALADFDVRFGQILHPSPASPLANKDWAGTITRQLAEMDIGLPRERKGSRASA